MAARTSLTTEVVFGILAITNWLCRDVSPQGTNNSCEQHTGKLGESERVLRLTTNERLCHSLPGKRPIQERIRIVGDSISRLVIARRRRGGVFADEGQILRQMLDTLVICGVFDTVHCSSCGNQTHRDEIHVECYVETVVDSETVDDETLEKIACFSWKCGCQEILHCCEP